MRPELTIVEQHIFIIIEIRRSRLFKFFLALSIFVLQKVKIALW